MHRRIRLMLSMGAVESLPEFLWGIVMKLPEFNLFSDTSARIFLISSSICPNFHGFPKLGGDGAVDHSNQVQITIITAWFKHCSCKELSPL